MANKYIYTFLPVDKLAKMNYVEHLFLENKGIELFPGIFVDFSGDKHYLFFFMSRV